jgi:7-dehydrocholesterol reductase
MCVSGHLHSNTDGLPSDETLQTLQSEGKKSRIFVQMIGILHLLLMLFLAAFFTVWWVALEAYNASVSEVLWGILSHPEWLFHLYQPPHADAATIFLAWIIFEALLFTALPGPIYFGQPTPAGKILPYKLNGFKCWLITISVIANLWAIDVIDLPFVARNWSEFLSAAAYYAWALAALSFLKAHLAPSHVMDRRFSGGFERDLR